MAAHCHQLAGAGGRLAKEVLGGTFVNAPQQGGLRVERVHGRSELLLLLLLILQVLLLLLQLLLVHLLLLLLML